MGNDNHQGLGSRINNHFAVDGGVELDLPDRRDLPTDLRRRVRIAELHLSGDWGVELESLEADQDHSALWRRGIGSSAALLPTSAARRFTLSRCTRARRAYFAGGDAFRLRQVRHPDGGRPHQATPLAEWLLVPQGIQQVPPLPGCLEC
jgi:hypothetical protein